VLPNEVFDLFREVAVRGHDLHVPHGRQSGNVTPERLREIKTDLLERMETIRSKSPAMVAQELWGLLLAYNLVRVEMMRLANDLRVEPTRISFVAAVRSIVQEWYWNADTATPGAIPKRLVTLRDHLRVFVLPPRRTERVYPRAVKIKMSNYARKRPSTTRPAN
jgi:hypothetical protein